MKKRTYEFFKALIDGAPALVVPFGRGRSYLVPAAEVEKVESGIITMSPLAVFLQECGFWWDREAHRMESRRWMRANCGKAVVS